MLDRLADTTVDPFLFAFLAAEVSSFDDCFRGAADAVRPRVTGGCGGGIPLPPRPLPLPGATDAAPALLTDVRPSNEGPLSDITE